LADARAAQSGESFLSRAERDSHARDTEEHEADDKEIHDRDTIHAEVAHTLADLVKSTKPCCQECIAKHSRKTGPSDAPAIGSQEEDQDGEDGEEQEEAFLDRVVGTPAAFHRNFLNEQLMRFAELYPTVKIRPTEDYIFGQVLKAVGRVLLNIAEDVWNIYEAIDWLLIDYFVDVFTDIKATLKAWRVHRHSGNNHTWATNELKRFDFRRVKGTTNTWRREGKVLWTCTVELPEMEKKQWWKVW
jgi:hypothetical protein